MVNYVDCVTKTGSVNLPRDFQVLGFSVSGQVLDSEGNGLQGITVLVNNKERAVTDSHG